MIIPIRFEGNEKMLIRDHEEEKRIREEKDAWINIMIKKLDANSYTIKQLQDLKETLSYKKDHDTL